MPKYNRYLLLISSIPRFCKYKWMLCKMRSRSTSYIVLWRTCVTSKPIPKYLSRPPKRTARIYLMVCTYIHSYIHIHKHNAIEKHHFHNTEVLFLEFFSFFFSLKKSSVNVNAIFFQEVCQPAISNSEDLPILQCALYHVYKGN